MHNVFHIYRFVFKRTLCSVSIKVKAQLGELLVAIVCSLLGDGRALLQGFKYMNWSGTVE